MKRWFNHTRKPVQDWDGYEESEYEESEYEEGEYEEGEYEESEYDWDGAGDELSTDEEEIMYSSDADDTYYGEEADDGAYYAGTGDIRDGVSEEVVYEEEIYEENAYYEDGESGEDGTYYEDGAGYDGNILSDDEFYHIEDEEEVPIVQQAGRRKGPAVLRRIGEIISDMSVIDRVIAATGLGVVVLAVVLGSVFISSRVVARQVSDFVAVGTQLEGIDTIGGAGLLAVADAQMAKFAVYDAVEDVDEEYGYDEEDYSSAVTVGLELVSIQKDLKIKFVNKETDRLIANVPFAVNVTDPDNKTTIWSDDDMDGVIYKENITPGNYKVVMEPLSDEKYARYIISTTVEPVEVRKNIKYEKVNVANEIKTEKEIDASKEDTAQNDIEVESALKDTVAWVESKVISEGYNEVAKSTIADPATVVSLDKKFIRATGSVSPGNESTPTPAPKITAVTLTPASVSLIVGQETTVQAQATVTDRPEGQALTYSISGGTTSIATCSIDSNGKITVKGVAAGNTSFIVTAACGGASNTATLNVAVTDKKSLSLDKPTATVFVGETVIINATVANATTPDPTVTAVSADTGVAKVSAVNKKAVTITGVKAGQTTVTVTFSENGETVEAKCVVSVKDNPKNDTKTLLKDKSGQQVYVMDNGTYREAHYADYYTAEKFYLLGEAKYTGWQTLNGKVYFFTAEGKMVTGEQVIQGAKYNFASDGSLVTGSGALGIDVSKWNGNIDWNAVKNSGINYVIIRCGYRGSSQGSLVVDPKFTANIKGATAAGLKVGVYFFTQAVNEVEAVQEASMVLEQIKNYKISYPVFLDVESSGGRADGIDKATRTAVCKAFCQTIQNAGYNAGVYANKSWLTTKLDPSALSAYKIWLAQYAAKPTYTGRYDLWQYRSTGSVSGISGNVDMNLSYLGY